MITDNRVVVDLGKVQWTRFYYKTRLFGYVRNTLPRRPTVHNVMHDETVTAQAREQGKLDEWIPVLRLKLSANETLKYTGEKAKSIWGEWQRRQFKKKEHK